MKLHEPYTVLPRDMLNTWGKAFIKFLTQICKSQRHQEKFYYHQNLKKRMEEKQVVTSDRDCVLKYSLDRSRGITLACKGMQIGITRELQAYNIHFQQRKSPQHFQRFEWGIFRGYWSRPTPTQPFHPLPYSWKMKVVIWTKGIS